MKSDTRDLVIFLSWILVHSNIRVKTAENIKNTSNMIVMPMCNN